MSKKVTVFRGDLPGFMGALFELLKAMLIGANLLALGIELVVAVPLAWLILFDGPM